MRSRFNLIKVILNLGENPPQVQSKIIKVEASRSFLFPVNLLHAVKLYGSV